MKENIPSKSKKVKEKKLRTILKGAKKVNRSNKNSHSNKGDTNEF